MNGDSLYLAMRAAAGELKAPEKQVQDMIRAVLKEHAVHSVWPKDF